MVFDQNIKCACDMLLMLFVLVQIPPGFVNCLMTTPVFSTTHPGFVNLFNSELCRRDNN